jgi:hypothetical protein
MSANPLGLSSAPFWMVQPAAVSLASTFSVIPQRANRSGSTCTSVEPESPPNRLNL